MQELSQSKLKELLHYDQFTGIFTWLVANNNRVSVGGIAGYIHTGPSGKKISHYQDKL